MASGYCALRRKMRAYTTISRYFFASMSRIILRVADVAVCSVVLISNALENKLCGGRKDFDFGVEQA
jgi:hypothetical protein